MFIKCVFLSHKDAAFNKTTRSLHDLQQKELGVKPEFRYLYLYSTSSLSHIMQHEHTKNNVSC